MNCPVYRRAKEIETERTKTNSSYAEARNKVVNNGQMTNEPTRPRNVKSTNYRDAATRNLILQPVYKDASTQTSHADSQTTETPDKQNHWNSAEFFKGLTKCLVEVITKQLCDSTAKTKSPSLEETITKSLYKHCSPTRQKIRPVLDFDISSVEDGVISEPEELQPPAKTFDKRAYTDYDPLNFTRYKPRDFPALTPSSSSNQESTSTIQTGKRKANEEVLSKKKRKRNRTKKINNGPTSTTKIPGLHTN